MTSRILAYHRISDYPSPGLEQWSVRPEVFRRQMWMLKKLGNRGVPVRELMQAIESGRPTEKLTGISFDDGYRDTVCAALPILDEFGFTASVYVVSDAIGSDSSWDQGESRARLASWDELGTLVESGWEIGMHSRSHPARFDLLRNDALKAEVCEGMARIRDRLETPVESFAYPHGHYSGASVAAVRAAGYKWAVTTNPGTVTAESPPFELPRYEIKRRDTLPEFAVLMRFGFLPRRRRTLSRLFQNR